MIPICNVREINKPYIDRYLEVLYQAAESGAFIKGKALSDFEENFGAYLARQSAKLPPPSESLPRCLGVNSGTDALILALLTACVKPGDYVITTNMSYVATAQAILMVGARPLFVDIASDRTDAMSRQAFNEVIRLADSGGFMKKITAMILVHMHGHPWSSTKDVAELCKHYKIALIEDCAQSHGAAVSGKATGLWGDYGCFSFFPTKNLGALGDGGMLVINNATRDKIERAQAIREHGALLKDYAITKGWNTRLDAIQAGFLDIKLQDLTAHNKARRIAAAAYTSKLKEALGDYVGKLVFCPDNNLSEINNSVWHHYILYFRNEAYREAVMNKLKMNGVESRMYYPFAFHTLPAFASDDSLSEKILDANSGYTNTLLQQQCSLALPLDHTISIESQDKVVELVSSAVKSIA